MSVPTSVIDKVQFGIVSPDDIELLQQVYVDSFEGIENGMSTPNSLYDGRMGTIIYSMLCDTCKLDSNHCPGHFGVIKFPEPIVNIFYIKYVIKILNLICLKCSNLLISDENKQMILETYNRDRLKLCKLKRESVCNNPLCPGFKDGGYENTLVYKANEKMFIQYKEKGTKDETGSKIQIILPSVVKFYFERIKDYDISVMGFSPVHSRPSWMIMDSMLVPPVVIRPTSVSNEGGNKQEDNMFKILSKIVKHNEDLKMIMASNNNILHEKVLPHYKDLCASVVNLVTNQLHKSPGGLKIGNMSQPVPSFKDLISGKEGLVRGKQLGKPVTGSARTVISGDPLIEIDEIGVPEIICKTLIQTEVVNKYNIERLKKHILNGDKTWPGASKVYKRSSGNEKALINPNVLISIANGLEPGDIVFRHLIDGDIFMFNRAPSLHKLSIMGKRVFVIQDLYSCRLSNLSTTPFNADFDGDEMNEYKPRSNMALAEIEQLMMSSNHIIDSVNSKPTIAPIQDDVLGLYFITKFRDHELGVDDFMYIINSCRYFNSDRTLELYEKNGKYTYVNLLDCILPDTLTCKSKDFVIVDGMFIEGVLNKGSIRGLVKIIFNSYGRDICAKVEHSMVRIADTFLMYYGFSCGLGDCLIPREIKKKIVDELNKAEEDNFKLVNQFSSGSVIIPITKKPKDDFEDRAKNIVNKCDQETSKTLEGYLKGLPQDKYNNFMHMVDSDAKGDPTNIKQILGYVGQQIVDEGRIEKSYGGRTEPRYPKFTETLKSRGRITDPFIDGIDAESYGKHSAGSRTGLIDTALKVRENGYLARKLAHLLSNLVVSYDNKVRYSNKKIISFSFGSYHFDTKYLFDVKIPFQEFDNKKIEDEYF